MHIVQYIVFCYAIFGALGGFNLKKKGSVEIALEVASYKGLERVACAFVAYILRPW